MCADCYTDLVKTSRDIVARLSALREHRVTPDRRITITPDVQGAASELKKLERRLGGVAEAWNRVCPPHLVDRTSIESLARGVLTVRVADAAARFELDRALRSGAEQELVRVSPSGVRRVRLVAGVQGPAAGDLSGR